MNYSFSLIAGFREFHDTFAMDANVMSHVFPTFQGGVLVKLLPHLERWGIKSSRHLNDSEFEILDTNNFGQPLRCRFIGHLDAL